MDDPIPRSPPPLLEPGRTCWRIEPAERMAFLVDGEAYFAAVREALRNARRSIYILGWDIDSRVELVPGGANDGLPDPLAEFLDALVRRRRSLHAYVLTWDFAMIFALEREWMPVYRLEKSTHRRLKFRLDDVHPIGGSHHQKVVVIDDRVAFVGGLDLTKCRWDTPGHDRENARRVDPDGKPYAPFHDIQVIVDGDAARALGDLSRMRWLEATRERLAPSPPVDTDPWPSQVEPEIVGPLDVAIVRTLPACGKRPQVEEFRALTVEAIARARRSIFIEQQYFTSSVAAEAIAQRLREPDGPEAVLVMSHEQCGWLEQRTMGVLRARIDRDLREADAHDRYRLYGSCGCAEKAEYIHVHSKLMTIDDEFLTVGSANLSNRSMGLDTECNLAIEARGDERIANAIRALRERLLAEHLGTTPQAVAAATARHPRLIDAIESLATRGRTLERFAPELSPELDVLVPESAFVDMERPIEPEQLAQELVEPDAAPSVRRRVAVLAGLALLIAGAMVAWRYTPLRELMSAPRLVALASGLQESPFAAFVVLGAYLVGGIVAFPITVLIAATGLVFGPWLGLALALPATMASAALGYAIGAKLGRNTVRRLAGRRLNRLSRHLGDRGLFAIAFVRVVPVAPFTVINLVAGASHIGWRDYLIGTFVAMTPGIVLTVAFVDRALAAMRKPSPFTFAVLAFVVAVIAVGSWAVAGWLARRERNRPRPAEHAYSP